MSAESKSDEAGPDGSCSPLGTQHPAPSTQHSRSTHRIRLGPPWEVVSGAGWTRHARNFGRPRTLDPAESVWLVCESIPGAAEVTLNGSVVAPTLAGGAFAAEITGLLRPRNTLIVAVASEEPLGPVALEIRSATV